MFCLFQATSQHSKLCTGRGIVGSFGGLLARFGAYSTYAPETTTSISLINFLWICFFDTRNLYLCCPKKRLDAPELAVRVAGTPVVHCKQVRPINENWGLLKWRRLASWHSVSNFILVSKTREDLTHSSLNVCISTCDGTIGHPEKLELIRTTRWSPWSPEGGGD